MNLPFVDASPTVTFYFNEGGIFRVDNATITNGTSTAYANGTVIELIAIVEGNLTYGFNNFSWNISGSWDILNQNWDSLSGWTKFGIGTAEISPEGQLHLVDSVGIMGMGKLMDIPDVYVTELKLKIDDYGTEFIDYHNLQIFSPNHKFQFHIHDDIIRIEQVGDVWKVFTLTNQEGVFYIWRLLFNNGTLNIYRDDVWIGEVENVYEQVNNDTSVWGTQIYATMEAHEDYLKISSNLYYSSAFPIINPYNFVVYGDNIIWCNFGEITSVAQDFNATYYLLGAVTFFPFLLFGLVLWRRKRQN